MVEYNLQPPIDISILEILLIIVCSFVGAFVHELMQFVGKGKRITIAVWINIIVTIVVDALICYAINPAVTQVHSRLIVVPPLLLGLMGTELINKLTTINGSLNIIEYVLGWFKITKSDKTATPTSPGEESEPKKEKDPASEKGEGKSSDKEAKATDESNVMRDDSSAKITDQSMDLDKILLIAGKAKAIDAVIRKLDDVFKQYAHDHDNDDLLNGCADAKEMASEFEDYHFMKIAEMDKILSKKMNDMQHKLYLADKLVHSLMLHSPIVVETDLDPSVIDNIRDLSKEIVVILRVPEPEKSD